MFWRNTCQVPLIQRQRSLSNLNRLENFQLGVQTDRRALATVSSAAQVSSTRTSSLSKSPIQHPKTVKLKGKVQFVKGGLAIPESEVAECLQALDNVKKLFIFLLRKEFCVNSRQIHLSEPSNSSANLLAGTTTTDHGLNFHQLLEYLQSPTSLKELSKILKKQSLTRKFAVSRIIRENEKDLLKPLRDRVAWILSKSEYEKKPESIAVYRVIINLCLCFQQSLLARKVFFKNVSARSFMSLSWSMILNQLADENAQVAYEDVLMMLQKGVSPSAQNETVLPKIMYYLSMANAQDDIYRLISAMDDFNPNPESKFFQNIRKDRPDAVINVWSPNLATMIIKAFGKDFRKAQPLINRLVASNNNRRTSDLKNRTHKILLCGLVHQALRQNDTSYVKTLLEANSSSTFLSDNHPIFRMLMTDVLKRKEGSNRGADEAISIFNIMVDKFGVKPTVTDWVVYSNALVRKGDVQEALDTIKSHILPAKNELDNSAESATGNDPWAKKKNNVPASSVAFSSVIAEYCRRDLIPEAERILQTMYSEGIRVTEITLIPLIAYYSRNGMEKEALAHYYRLHSLDGEEVESTMASIGCIYHSWLMREYSVFRNIPSSLQAATSSTAARDATCWSKILSNQITSSGSKDLLLLNSSSGYQSKDGKKITTISTPKPTPASLSSKDTSPTLCPDMSHILFSFTQMMESHRPLSFVHHHPRARNRIARSLFTYHIDRVLYPSRSRSPKTGYPPALVHLKAAEQLYFNHGRMDDSSRHIWEARLARVYKDLGMIEEARQIVSPTLSEEESTS